MMVVVGLDVLHRFKSCFGGRGVELQLQFATLNISDYM